MTTTATRLHQYRITGAAIDSDGEGVHIVARCLECFKIIDPLRTAHIPNCQARDEANGGCDHDNLESWDGNRSYRPDCDSHFDMEL